MDTFKIVLLFFIFFISGITLWSLIASFIRVRQSLSSWLQTTGRVTSFVMNYGTPSISYEYDAQGKVFTGNKFTPGPMAFYPKSSGTSFPKSFYLNESGRLRFSPGNSVEVFYNPINPSDSALVQEMPSNKGLLIVVPLIAVLVALYVNNGWFVAHTREIWPLGFLIVGLVAFLYACTWIRRHWQARGFPLVRGRMIGAEAVYSGGENSGYTAIVEFEYEVNSCLYRSRQLRDLPLTILKSSRQDAEQQVEKLRSNPTPEVFYNPEAPWDVFLFLTNLLGCFLPMLLSLPFLVIGVLFLSRNFNHWR